MYVIPSLTRFEGRRSFGIGLGVSRLSSLSTASRNCGLRAYLYVYETSMMAYTRTVQTVSKTDDL